MSCLTRERLKELLEYDPNTGNFYWKIQVGQRAQVGKVAGGLNSRGYQRVCIDGKSHLMHRLACLYMTGEWPSVVDHINCEPSDNRWVNLRLCDRGQNAQNSRLSKRSQTGVKGVSFDRGKYRVQISGKSYGRFDDVETAERVAKEIRDQLHREFARHA